MAYWLFGQIYEAIVYSPNWIINPVSQIRRLNEFYKVTSARNYFEPIVPIGVLLIWIIYFFIKDKSLKRKMFPAFMLSIIAMIINIYIVVALLTKIFSSAYWNNEVILRNLLIQWNIMNIVRIILIFITLIYLFNFYRMLDRNNSK